MACTRCLQKQKQGFTTTACHVGQDPDNWVSGAVVPPVTMATTYKQLSPEECSSYVYSRIKNPSRVILEGCIAALENGKHCLAFSSGCGAVTTVLSLLNSGDHVVSSFDVYSGTSRLLRHVISRRGIETTFTEFLDHDKFRNAIKSNTKMIWLETPTNPLLKVVDIAALTKITKASNSNIIVVVDNTFLTSYLQKPFKFGADIVVYSLTKYMNGHSDVVMGAAVVNDNELEKKLRFLQSAMGAVPSPMDCYLVNRSLKTLALRMEQHMKSSLIIAKWLKSHPKISEVLHPGLPSHPQHNIALKQSKGHCGTFSFRHSGGLTESKKFLSSLKLFTLAESLGGYESLIQLPSMMVSASLPPEKRAELGITDAFIRISVGLEDTEDLVRDLDQALNQAFR